LSRQKADELKRGRLQAGPVFSFDHFADTRITSGSGPLLACRVDCVRRFPQFVINLRSRTCHQYTIQVSMPESIHTDAPAELPDHDLLRRFVLDTDEAAFAEIVRRHQRLVMGICRRVTGDQTDAEDAFQAVFLALARRPRSIRRATSLSSWLYTVAWRTSHRLVRRRKSPPVEVLDQSIPSDDPDPLEKITAEQNADVLHAELNLLPERYRQVLVMTYFAQQTSQQIADQLHLTKGTIDGRIRQARNILRVRLARRGISLGVLAAVAMSLHSPGAIAAVTPGLLENTIHLGSQTLLNSLPGTVDLSRLEPLMRSEIAMVKLNAVAGIGACVALVVGVAGMAQVDVQPASAPPERVTSVIDTTTTIEEEVVSEGVNDVVLGTAAPDSGGNHDLAAQSDQQANAMSPSDAAASAEARDQWLRHMMNQPIPDLEFSGETPLREILDVLTEHYTLAYGGELGYRMTIWSNDSALDQTGVDSLDEVVISEAMLRGVPLRQALDLIFAKTESLTWDIRGGILEVTSVQELEKSPRHRETRAYRAQTVLEPELELVIREHLRSRQIYFGTEGDGDTKQNASAGSLTTLGSMLIITHHRRGLETVEELLKSLGIPVQRVDRGASPGSQSQQSKTMVAASAEPNERRGRGDHGDSLNDNTESG